MRTCDDECARGCLRGGYGRIYIVVNAMFQLKLRSMMVIATALRWGSMHRQRYAHVCMCASAGYLWAKVGHASVFGRHGIVAIASVTDFLCRMWVVECVLWWCCCCCWAMICVVFVLGKMSNLRKDLARYE